MPRDYMAEAHVRRARCEAIAVKARAMGLDVDWQKVNYYYSTFCRWDEGRYLTGYLMKSTGTRYLPREGK